MIGTRRFLTAGMAAIICLSVGVATAGEPTPARAQSAVKYREWPTGGGLRSQGRVLPSTGSSYYGIDINSRVGIEVDTEALVAILNGRYGAGSDPQVAETSQQLATLAGALAGVDSAYRGVVATGQAHVRWIVAQEGTDRAAAGLALTEFMSAAGAMGQQMTTIFEALIVAIQTRLINDGVATDAARRKAEIACNPILSGDLADHGYDWDAMRNLFAQEIALADARMTQLAPDLGFFLDIRAHLQRAEAGGVASALPLPGYNDVVGDAASYYKKIRFKIPDDQKKLFKHYQEVAKNAADADNALEALMIQLELDYEVNREQIDVLLAELRAIAQELAVHANDLVAWAEPAKLDPWLAVKREALANHPDVAALLDELQPLIEVVRADVVALQAYARLGNELAGLPAKEVVARLRPLADELRAEIRAGQRPGEMPGVRALLPSTWRVRIEEIKEVQAELNTAAAIAVEAFSDPAGPAGVLFAMQGTLETIPDRLESKAADALNGFLGLGAYAQLPVDGTFPTPVGQRRLGIEITADLDTAFDLKTAPGGRHPGDQVVVSISVFRGEDDRILGWRDSFLVSVYGWQDATLAGLAFVQATSTTRWQPAATFSWYLDHRGWPGDGDDGLGGLTGLDWFGGLGLTVTQLNFTDTQDVEIGTAVSVAFLNRMVQAGYGWNLQDSGQPFYFFSAKLFSASGFIAKP